MHPLSAALPPHIPLHCPFCTQEVDILLPNAGLALGVAPVHEVEMEDVQTMLETNGADEGKGGMQGCWVAVRSALPVLHPWRGLNRWRASLPVLRWQLADLAPHPSRLLPTRLPTLQSRR